MDDVWLNRFEEIRPYKPDKSHFRYYQFWGIDELLQKLASFMTKYFKPWNTEISVDNVSKISETCTNFLEKSELDMFLQCTTLHYTINTIYLVARFQRSATDAGSFGMPIG